MCFMVEARRHARFFKGYHLNIVAIAAKVPVNNHMLMPIKIVALVAVVAGVDVDFMGKYTFSGNS